MTAICVVVKHARGLELEVEHSSGIRALVHPDTLAFTALLRRLVLGEPATTTVPQPVMTFVPVGFTPTKRA